MPLKAFTDVFLRSVDEEMFLGFKGWTRLSEGGVLFLLHPPADAYPADLVEILPPSHQRRVQGQPYLSVWESYTKQEKEKAIGFLAAYYTQSLIRGGFEDEIKKNGVPTVVLAYDGYESPLALAAGGEVKVYPSPVATR